MNKLILNLGKALNKTEQKSITGGRNGCPANECRFGYLTSCRPCGNEAEPPNE